LIPGCFSTWDAGKEKNRSRWPVFLCPGFGDLLEINDIKFGDKTMTNDGML
jgi:hypothetical protein